jgi:hypothetical protein
MQEAKNIHPGDAVGVSNKNLEEAKENYQQGEIFYFIGVTQSGNYLVEDKDEVVGSSYSEWDYISK